MFVIACMLVTQSLVGQIQALEPQDSLPALEPVEPQEIQAPKAPDTPAPIAATAEPLNLSNPQFVPGTYAYVNATSLALRTGPEKSAALIHYIEKDAVVTVLTDVITPVPLTIGDKSGFWIYIQHNDHKGYVFDAFLATAPPNLKDTLDVVCVPGQKVGAITSQTTYKDLARLVGEVNLAMARIPLAEKGKYEEATAVFPGDKHKELIIQWDVLRVSPKAVIVHGSNWKTESGIGVGARVEDFIVKNTAPLNFLGFGHEYAGYVTSWGGGTLETTHPLRKSILLYLEPDKPYTEDDFKAVQGEGEFSSAMDEAKALNLKVSSMTILLNK
jgi:hypothetical protein